MIFRMARKDKDDPNLFARSVLDQIIAKHDPEAVRKENPGKNPVAVALGLRGGSKGGKARAEQLSSKRRKAIAQKAAKARWSKTKKK